MSDQKMTPRKSFNASIPCSGNSEEKKVKPPEIPALVLPESQEFQCIACKYYSKSPNEIHQHQTHSHTSEELSLSIIGLQVLYNFNKSRNTVAVTESKLDDKVVNPANENNKKTPSAVLVPDSNQPTYPEVQKEPICLKVSIPFTILKTNVPRVENYALDSKSCIEGNNNSVPKNAKLSIHSIKKITAPLGYLPIRPAPPKIKELKNQSTSAKNFAEVKVMQESFTKIDVPQTIRNNILGKTLVSHNGSNLPDQHFSTNNENSHVSLNKPACLKLTQENLSLNSINVATQEQSEGIFKKPTEFFKKPEDFKGTEETIARPELTIEKIVPNFKRPRSISKKPALSIQKLPVCTKKQEVNKPKKEVNSLPENQHTGSSSKNLNNLCKNVQKNCLKRPRTKSPLDIIKEPLRKPISDLTKIKSILEAPVTPIQILEPSSKKLKTLLEVPPEETKSENVPNRKHLPIIEVGDGVWYESVKGKLSSGSELPTDIMNISIHDLPTQSFELSQNASANLNYNDLSSDTLINLDSYLMTSEIQPQEELNSTSQIGVEKMNNNFSSLNSKQGADAGFDYSNADFLFMDNQHPLLPVNSNENAWNSDGNPVYTELLPVFYS